MKFAMLPARMRLAPLLLQRLLSACLVLWALSACAGVSAGAPVSTPSPVAGTSVAVSPTKTTSSVTPTPVSPLTSPTASASPVTPTASSNWLVQPSPTPTVDPLGLLGCNPADYDSSPFPPHQAPQICLYDFSFPFARPIAAPARDTIEAAYRFGATQKGFREPHHGVDFINKAGVPVLSIAPGVVEIAGDDQTVNYATHTDFYGNLVAIQHRVAGFPEPFFSLYGHLLSINVQPGDQVQAGDPIGEVGLGGIAAGTHLHLEIRYALNDYATVRNPELWLTPPNVHAATPAGVVAGRFLDAQGDYLPIDNIMLQRIAQPGEDDPPKIYLRTYEEEGLIGLQPWMESFGTGELPPGKYRLVYVQKRPVEFYLEVQPAMLTYIIIFLD